MSTREQKHKTASSTPCVGEAGNTGDWRTERPVLDQSKCLAVKQGRVACMQCWMFCPEAVITRTVPAQVDLKYCKGCGICVEVCPAGAITMEPEPKGSE
jgi:pyruvate ferredoxin oxidoreductase delta subunit